MFKTIFAVAAASAFSAPVLAGPYVNLEVNSSLTGSDYTGTTTDLAIGWEGSNWFAQGGPIITAADGGDSTTDFIGYVGGSYPLSESVGAYGEFSVQTADAADNAYTVKVGAKYTF